MKQYLQLNFNSFHCHLQSTGRWPKSTFLNPYFLLYCFLYYTHSWPNLNYIHQFPEDVLQFPNFLCFWSSCSLYPTSCLYSSLSVSIFCPILMEILFILQSLSNLTSSMKFFLDPVYHITDSIYSLHPMSQVFCTPQIKPTRLDLFPVRLSSPKSSPTSPKVTQVQSNQPSWFAKD